MKPTERQMQRLVHYVLQELKAQNILTFKVKEEEVEKKMIHLIKADYIREHSLDLEVNKMMDDLERKNPGTFQRYKMFPLLKKRLAQEKGIIL
ncbi:MAG: DUF507 family protein [Bdellovibrionales bacterium]|nr:DUF507 family protein [Bdellovibrionales bacterium]